MKIDKKLIFIFVLLNIPLISQEFTLKQCIEYAEKNNSNIKVANYDAEISREFVNEQTGKGLPQINFSGSLDDKLKIATQLLPGEIMGRPGTFIPVKMGTKYTVNGTFSLTQKIFDASFWVGLKAAKISEDLSLQNIERTNEQTLYDVTSAFYRAIIINKKLENYKSILISSEQTLKSMELKYKTGTIKKIDVDKIKVSYNNTVSLYQQTELSYKQALNNLKFYMGMSVDNEIEIAKELPDYSTETTVLNTPANFVDNRIDYKIQKTNLLLYEADKENNTMAYLPSLSFYANYGYSAMNSQFNFLKGESNWYNSSAIGLELKIPIFSGFQKYSKVEQSSLNIEKAIEKLKYSEQMIKVEYSNYYMQFKNAVDNIQNEKENLALAESVFKNTQIQFSEGASSSLELVQAESSLRESQNNYYSKLLTLYLAKLDLEKSQGSLSNFINNQK